MQLDCPTLGIYAINRTNNTLIRDNLYQYNTSTFHNEFYSASMHVCFPVCIKFADLKV